MGANSHVLTTRESRSSVHQRIETESERNLETSDLIATCLEEHFILCVSERQLSKIFSMEGDGELELR